MHLLKMDFEIAKVVDNHGKSLVQTQAVLEYILEKSGHKTDKLDNKSIFNTPKGEA